MVEKLLPLAIADAVVVKQGKCILGPIDIQISESGTMIIMGPNGSGKTTLLKTMHGLERIRRGTIHWNCSVEQARQQQAFVFQTPVMLRRTVFENIAFPLRLRRMKTSVITKRTNEWLDRIGLTRSASLDAHVLSGGEKQRLALARALIGKPALLLLDEPTANLDGTSTREIETIITSVANSGTRIIMTTHDPGQAKRLADEVLFLYRGKLHERSAAKVFFSNPATREATAFVNREIVE